MGQVNRTKIIYTVLCLLSVFFISGCASKNQYTSTSKNFDKSISKDQLLHAVKRVFMLTDKNAFIIDSYRNDLTITKPKAVYKLYTMDMRNDNFYFKVDETEDNSTINATVSIFRTYGEEDDEKYYLDADSFTYKLFWDRVEYILGLKEKWKMCNYLFSNGFMCDLVDLDNSWFVDKNRIDINTTTNEKENTQEIQSIEAVETINLDARPISEETINPLEEKAKEISVDNINHNTNG